MRNFLFFFFFLFFQISLVAQNQKFKAAGYEMEIIGDLKDFSFSTENKKAGEDLEIVTLKLQSPTAAVPPKFQIKWSLPSINIAGHWSTAAGARKIVFPDWYPSRVSSAMTVHAPVITLFGYDDSNHLTFAISEALNAAKLMTGVREEDGLIYNTIELFADRHKKIKSYSVEIYLDQRPQKFSESLHAVGEWWAAKDGFEPAAVPTPARQPMYSTWYSYHQSVSAEALIKECQVAKKMGFESIIVDDGWQTLDSNRGYAYCGDWEPERIPEMKKLVDAIHDLDMKFLLWYAVPLVGEKSKAYQKMKGKFLRYWNGQGAYELDPRYPEVREFIIDTYKNAMRDWGVDGFKFDFLGRFVARENTVLEATDGRDFASVYEATDRLMTDIISELRKVNPEIMIEFRQPYIGPLMRKYGNIFRAGDCPNAASENRVRTTDLRLLSGNTAIHSDMIMWHYDESVEEAAMQMVNIIFSVPQISVRLEDIPKAHFDMLKFYIQYWNDNQKVLLDGKFLPVRPQQNYPLIAAQNLEKKVVGVFNEQVVTLDNNTPAKLDVINGKKSKRIILDIEKDLGDYHFSIKNCLGKEIETKNILLKKGTVGFDVPICGMICFRKK